MTKQKIRQLLIIILTFNIWLAAYSQSDTFPIPTIVTSYQPYFDSHKIQINYSYSDSSKTHDYSNNWDFDGDGKTDGLYFIGTGGVHSYFYLRIVLSSDKKIRNFSFLELDMPCIGDITELKNAKFYPSPFFPKFVVDDFYSGRLDDNANAKIYLHLDSFTIIPTEWKKRGVTSHYLLLYFDKGEINIKNFVE